MYCRKNKVEQEYKMSARHHFQKNNTYEENQLFSLNTKNSEHKNLQILKQNVSLLKDRVERLSFMISEIHSVLENSTSVSRF